MTKLVDENMVELKVGDKVNLYAYGGVCELVECFNTIYVKRATNELISISNYPLKFINNDIVMIEETVKYVSDFECVKLRRNDKCWYVLHYDVVTSEYLKELEFKTFNEARREYVFEKPLNENDRIELIFAPQDDDEYFSDNEVLYTRAVGV